MRRFRQWFVEQVLSRLLEITTQIEEDLESGFGPELSEQGLRIPKLSAIISVINSLLEREPNDPRRELQSIIENCFLAPLRELLNALKDSRDNIAALYESIPLLSSVHEHLEGETKEEFNEGLIKDLYTRNERLLQLMQDRKVSWHLVEDVSEEINRKLKRLQELLQFIRHELGGLRLDCVNCKNIQNLDQLVVRRDTIARQMESAEQIHNQMHISIIDYGDLGEEIDKQTRFINEAVRDVQALRRVIKLRVANPEIDNIIPPEVHVGMIIVESLEEDQHDIDLADLQQLLQYVDDVLLVSLENEAKQESEESSLVWLENAELHELLISLVGVAEVTKTRTNKRSVKKMISMGVYAGVFTEGQREEIEKQFSCHIEAPDHFLFKYIEHSTNRGVKMPLYAVTEQGSRLAEEWLNEQGDEVVSALLEAKKKSNRLDATKRAEYSKKKGGS